MIITTDRLRALRACAEQVEVFKAITDGSADVTEEWCVTHAKRFDWGRASRHLLPAPARAEYERVTAAAWAEYERVTAAAWAECERVTAPALAEYERVGAHAGARYARVTAPARAEYERVTAGTFGRLLNHQRGRNHEHTQEP